VRAGLVAAIAGNSLDIWRSRFVRGRPALRVRIQHIRFPLGANVDEQHPADMRAACVLCLDDPADSVLANADAFERGIRIAYVGLNGRTRFRCTVGGQRLPGPRSPTRWRGPLRTVALCEELLLAIAEHCGLHRAAPLVAAPGEI
jgi:hypothetical protein